MKASRAQIRKVNAEYDKILIELSDFMIKHKILFLDRIKSHTFRHDPDEILEVIAEGFMVHVLEKFCDLLDEKIEMNNVLQESKDIINNKSDD